MISIQIRALKGHTERLKDNFTYSLKEANDKNMEQKEENNQLLNLQ